MEQTEETQSKLQSDFTAAASSISKATHLSLQQEQQLQLYALYKQATRTSLFHRMTVFYN
jgi:acyl-CoA-binding protein